MPVGRVISIGDDVRRVRVRNEQLVAEPRVETGENHSAPLEDLDAVLIDSTQGLFLDTWALQRMVEYKVVLVLSDRTHHPAGIFLPLHGIDMCGSVIQSQMAMTASRTKRAWQALVVGKISAQADVVQSNVPLARHLRELARKVRSGDPDNYEAQAARAYWPELLRDGERRQGGTRLGFNAALDYGYAIVRSLLARAVVGAGLNTTLAVHHSSRTNPFALVDDLIEPLRPVVDAHLLLCDLGVEAELSVEDRRQILTIVTTPLRFQDRIGPLTEVVERYASAYRRYVEGTERTLECPTMIANGRDQ